jgi:tetratricopeptide (TPR) repeat protein
MDRDELIKQLIFWHENDKHEQIIGSIEKIPQNEWDFELAGLYARALNNLDRYKEALDHLIVFEDEGRENGVWNFRVGYSLYYLNRETEAAEYFQKAIDFGDDGEDTQKLLKYSLFESKTKILIMDVVKLLENGEHRIEKIQEKSDEIMIEINNLRNKIFENDIRMEESVKKMISEKIINIIKHFNLNIDHEILIRRLDG